MNDRHIGDNNTIQSPVQNGDNYKQYLLNWCLFSHKQCTVFSENSIRGLFLLNGSACIALLAFWGSLIDHEKAIPHWQVLSLVCFVLGCFFAVTCSFAAYASQIKFTASQEYDLTEKTYDAMEAEKRGKFFNGFAIGVGTISGILFLFGCCIFAGSLWHQENKSDSTFYQKIMDSSELSDSEKVKVMKVLKK